MEYMKARLKDVAAADTHGHGTHLVEVHYLAGQAEGKIQSGYTHCGSLLEMMFSLADKGWRLLFSADGFHFFERAEEGERVQVTEGLARRQGGNAANLIPLDYHVDARGWGQGQ